MLGDAMSKTTALRCFHIHHAVSIMSDKLPLRNAPGVDLAAFSDHSTRSSSAASSTAVDRIHDSTSYQIKLEKGHPVRGCRMGSYD